MTKIKLIIGSTLICCLLLNVLGSPKAVHSAQTRMPQPIRPEVLSWDWATEQWTGNEKPFIKMKREIDEAVSKKGLTRTTLEQYRKEAQEKPRDPAAQFRWGYALLQAPKAGMDFGSRYWRAYTPVISALAKAPSPRSYEYAKLRFLLMTLEYQHAPLKNIGERLLRRDPQDVMVKSYLVRYLASSDSPPERKRALTYAQGIVKTNPKWLGGYSALGFVYMQNLFLYGDLSSADKAVNAYQQYLKLIPASQKTNRRLAQMGIANIKSEKARQQKNGFTPPIIVRG